MISPYFFANRGGIVRISSASVTVGADSVTIGFAPHSALRTPYRGLVIVRLSQPIPDGTTATLPVSFVSGGATPITPTTLGNTPATVADFPGEGIYLFYYDNVEGILQQLTGTL